MLTSTFADLNDKFFHYKRQTYLFAFPMGIIVCIMYLLGSLQSSEIGTYIVAGMIVELGVFVFWLIFLPRLMRLLEYILYISFSTYFFILTQIAINAFLLAGGLGPSQLGDVLHSLSMWMIVFMLGAYLTTSKLYVRILIIFIFMGMIAMAIANLWALSSSGNLFFPFVFRWINAFASVSMATLLLQRMGVLQQNYASTDSLTGLLNRRALYEILKVEIERSARYGNPLSIIIFDVDYFKNINDTYGHIMGDNVLKSLSELVAKTIRQVDRFGRWGGEEFLLVLPDTDNTVAGILAGRLCEMVRESDFGKSKNVTASFGVASYYSGSSLEDMLRGADNAMYQAKQNGRDQVVVNSEMRIST